MAYERNPSGATRRTFLGGAIAAGVAAVTGCRTVSAETKSESRGDTMIELPPLPFGESDLAPHISAETISFHYGKHHRAYVDNTNKLIAGTDLERKSLEEIIRAAAAKPESKGLFNNAAQVWNHTFYWQSLKPKGGGQPAGALIEKINADFGDFAKFREAFSKAAVTQFGSGWAWLVLENGKLRIEQTSNAETPLTSPGKRPLLTIDVWEHAYYVDWRNRRPDYVTAVIDHLLNWDFAVRNLG